MPSLIRFVRYLAITCLTAMLGFGCGGESSSSGNSNTNWLRACSADADCGGGLGCLCGTCTLGCSTTSDCNRLGQSSTCASPAAAGAACAGFRSPATSLCLATCNADKNCEAGQSCVDGACAPHGTRGTDASAGGTGGNRGNTGGTGNVDASMEGGETGGVRNPSPESGPGGQSGAGGTVIEPSCNPDAARCSGVCKDTESDPANCGGCGHACAPTEECAGGQCRAYCGAGFVYCPAKRGPNSQYVGAGCENIDQDPQNCGGCGKVCKASEWCSAGLCVPTCAPGTTFCNGVCFANDDFLTDATNCNGCGNACDAPGGTSPNHVCAAGKCSCTGGLVDCGGKCTDSNEDPFNCGGCGKVCPDPEVCSAGKCVATCASSTISCNGACSDLTTDVLHCNGCGTSCAEPGATCTAGGCKEPACAAGSTSCPMSVDRCVDTSKDPMNCGSCDKRCVGGTCVSGACQCSDGLTQCGDACVNVAADFRNCLRCGNVCAPGEVCSSGGCAPPNSCAPGLVGCNNVPDGGRIETACFCGSCSELSNANGVVCAPHESCVNGACQ